MSFLRLTAALTVAALLCCISAASPLERSRNVLRDVPTVATLNVTEYLGHWYQMYTDSFDGIFEPSAFCATAEYGLLPNGTVSVHNIDRKGGYNGTRGSVRGYAYQTSPSTFPGRLAVVFPFSPAAAPYWVLLLGPVVDGQYQYSVVSDFDKLSLFVLARNVAEFNASYKDKVMSFLTTMGFDTLFNYPQVCPQGPQCEYGM
jgi:lipocalin